MANSLEYTVLQGQLDTFRDRLDFIEGTLRSREMVQSIVPDAGGVVKQSESNVPAGREPCHPTLEALAKETYAAWGAWTTQDGHDWWDDLASEIQLRAQELIEIIEARRRTQDA